MSTTATQSPTAGAQEKRDELRTFVENREQFRCPSPACDGPIPLTHVISKIDIRTGVRTVRILCPACDQVFLGRFVLRMERWELLDSIERVTDAKTITGTKARVSHTLGELRASSH